jgi:hypothetical protein
MNDIKELKKSMGGWNNLKNDKECKNIYIMIDMDLNITKKF